MNNKTQNIIIGAIGVAVFIGMMVLFIASKDSNSSANNFANNSSVSSTGFLSVLENNFDFGKISMANGKVSHKFEIENKSPAPIKINKIYTSCMCTVAVLEKNGIRKGPYGMPGHSSASLMVNEIVNSGEKATIEAVFDPAAHGPQGVGLVKRTIYIETDSSNQPILELNFEASIIL